jgi:hypothetical protein
VAFAVSLNINPKTVNLFTTSLQSYSESWIAFTNKFINYLMNKMYF